MQARAFPIVWRYLAPGDRFVRVRVCGPDVLAARWIQREESLGREAYQRLVVEACCPDLAARDEPEDASALEDVYHLCTEVNPQLAIEKVRLPDSTPSSSPRPERAPSTASFLRLLRRRAWNLERRLSDGVVGQAEAVGAVARAARKAAAGLARPDRPLASFLFVGRTGTGKTELARRLAAELFPEQGGRGLIRIDCSEYGMAHEYAKLIGAPPGYVGYEDGGYLTERLRRRSGSVVVFDEIEKAHGRMHNLLLQVLDEGSITDGSGDRQRLDRSFVILTSNAGAEEIAAADETLGFAPGSAAAASDQMREITDRSLRRCFSPEFLGRIDEQILFGDLSLDHARLIARIQLGDLATRCRCAGRPLRFTPAVAGWVASRGLDERAGAREIRRVIQREIEGPLATWLLERERRGPGGPGGPARILLSIREGEPQFRPED